MNSTDTKLIEVTESIADLVDRVKKKEAEAVSIETPAVAANTAEENYEPILAAQPHTHSIPTAGRQTEKPQKMHLHTAAAAATVIIALVIFQEEVGALINNAVSGNGENIQLAQQPSEATPPAPVAALASSQRAPASQADKPNDGATLTIAQNEIDTLPSQNIVEITQADTARPVATPPQTLETPDTTQAARITAPASSPAPLPVATPTEEAQAAEVAAIQAEKLTPAPAQTSDTQRRGAWLLAQPADSYTVQIAAMGSEQALRKFIAANNLDDRAAYFQFSRNNKQLHVAVLDIFEEPGKARLAIKQLPPNVAEMKPWVRKLSSIQNIITN